MLCLAIYSSNYSGSSIDEGGAVLCTTTVPFELRTGGQTLDGTSTEFS